MSISDLTPLKILETLGKEFFSHHTPTPIGNPCLVDANPLAAELVGIEPSALESEDFLAWLAGKNSLPGHSPLAMVYAGHQFGSYVPQLGDGRAILIAELADKKSTGHWELQLKGAGKTAFSRFGDGRAVLRSTIREYLCSEAMSGLGIPTTRGLAIAASDEPVQREQTETAATLIRMARSHFRFGSFEYFYYQNQRDSLQKLADHVIEYNFPELTDKPDKYHRFFYQVVSLTARLIANWQSVGFVHGVMNTDNMSIIGDTLDYGPFGFLDQYNPKYIFNHTDQTGRYTLENQPAIAFWNLNALAHALSPLIELGQLRESLSQFQQHYTDHYLALMRAKLGLQNQLSGDDKLIEQLLAILEQQSVDYTIFFRRLGHCMEKGEHSGLVSLCNNPESLTTWLGRYSQRLSLENLDGLASRMNQANPKYILRNYMCEIAIRKAEDEGDYSEVTALRKLLATPFDEHPDMEHYAALPPDWSSHLDLSCSS